MSEIDSMELVELPEDEYVKVEDLLNMILENPEAFPDVIISDYDYIEY